MEILKNSLLLGCYEFKFLESGNYNKYSKTHHRKYGGVWEKEKLKILSLKAENKLVNLKILRSLGFCKSGITKVSDYLKLDKSKNYSVNDIVDLFKNLI